MVFIIDEGSTFDVPIEKVWRFMQMGREQHKHVGRTNMKIEPQGDSSILSFETEGPGGNKIQNRNKSTSFPPVGRVVEYLEGPLAGSRAVTYYIPMGQKTGITVVGEFVSKTIPEAQIKSVVMEIFEKSFNEDVENLKNFH